MDGCQYNKDIKVKKSYTTKIEDKKTESSKINGLRVQFADFCP